MKKNNKEMLEKWNSAWQKHLTDNKLIWLLEDELYASFFQKFSLTKCNFTSVNGNDEIYIYFSSNAEREKELSIKAVLFKNRDKRQYVLKIESKVYRTFPMSSPIYLMIESFPWRVMKKEFDKTNKYL